jgi:hypothetical protein
MKKTGSGEGDACWAAISVASDATTTTTVRALPARIRLVPLAAR